MAVLQRLLHAALRRKIAAQHLRSLGVHHLRIGGRALCNFQEGIGIEAELFGEHQAFGERQPVQTENEIDRQFGAAAVADIADMKAARA